MGEPTLSLNDDFEAWLILAKPDGALEIFFDQLFKVFFILDFEHLAFAARSRSQRFSARTYLILVRGDWR